MIPTDPLFESFLADTYVSPEPPQGPHENLTTFGNPLRTSDRPNLYLIFPDSKLKPASVIKAIQRTLAELDCESDQASSIAALALIAETQPSETSAVAHANACLANVISARYLHYCLGPNKPESGYRVDLDELVLETFNPQNLLYWGERTRSYWPIDLNTLRGNLVLTRKPCHVPLIAWGQETQSLLIQKWGRTAETLMDCYYQAVNRFHERQLSEIIRNSVAILEAGALLLFDEASFLDSPFIKKIGLFTWTQDRRPMGWALLTDGYVHINMLPEEAVPEYRDWLRREFSFDRLTGGHPFDATIRTYARFMQRAWRHKHNARADEAFLHFVISLDLLLGEAGRSTDSVCERAAMLRSAQHDADMDSEKKSLQALYKARSKYVHEGRSVSDSDLSSVETVCLDILWILLTARGQGTVEDRDQWLRRIDFAAAAVRVGKPVDEQDLRPIGIRQNRDPIVPPNRIQDLNAR